MTATKGEDKQGAEVTVTVKIGDRHKTYQLNETSPSVKNERTGKTTLSHHQPASSNNVIPSFSKVYVNVAELEKELNKK